MNSNASVKARVNFIGVSGVFCNHLGVVLATYSKLMYGFMDAESAKLIAIREGLILACDWDIPIDLVETDVLKVVHRLKRSSLLSHNALAYLHVKPMLAKVSCNFC